MNKEEQATYTRMVQIRRVAADGEADSRAGGDAERRGGVGLGGVVAADVGGGDVGHLNSSLNN